jgi:GNAT superfamily N-acetyltransferase
MRDRGDAGPDGVEVSTIDPADTRAFDEWFAVLHETDLETGTGGPGWQRAERLAMALDAEGPEEHRCLVARRGGRVVGIADLELFRRENRHVARLEVRVPERDRRRGVGTALVAGAARLARDAGRAELGGMDESPARPGYVDAAGPFARRLGFSAAQHMVRRRLTLPLDARHAARLRAHPGASPAGYLLSTFFDRWPEASLDDRCELGRRMSTDVPTGEQELDEEEWDERRVRGLEAALAAQNRAKVSTAAVHEATGRMVAFTEVVVPLGAPESAWQHDTLVTREHRGHGLGFAMKAANLWAVQQRHPGVRAINTWNAAENAPMIAVNEAMGFEVVSTSVYWRKDLGPVLVPPTRSV